MSKFALGDKVKNVISNDIGYVINIYPPRRGRQLYKVKYDDRETDEISDNLQADIDLTDPFERIKENFYDHYSDYLKGNTAFKIHSSNNSTISSLKASRTLFRPYQFKPLLKFLNSDNKRLLIADEVGLGKTIEAGHIMLEMKARGEFHNALVICPMSLKAKWATELSEKFGLDFIEIEKKEHLIQEFQYHNGNVLAVVNYDKIRNNSDILKIIEEREIRFSIVVCDESHKLRNNTTMIYQGAERLLQFADSVVFMSATPIMIDEKNLYNQLHLLDEGIYDNAEVFRNNVQLNKPFVKALSQLNSGVNLSVIAHELSTSEVTTFNTINDVETAQTFLIKDYFKDYPIYQDIIQMLNGNLDTPSVRAQLQYNLSEMNPMNTIFSRTRKREVTQDWSQAERNPFTHHVSLTVEEKEAYDQAVNDYMEEHTYIDNNGNLRSDTLGLVTIKRQLASSVWAYQNRDEDLTRGIDRFSEYEDAKVNQLLAILEKVFESGNNKIIIFAIFKKTLKYLNIRLRKAGYNCALIYGDSTIDKKEILHNFEHNNSINVLLSSEVGSEGLDMQFCNTMVNYDLPWNPMVVEQRIGRIDRFGQLSPKVNINTIVVKESILEDIYTRLLTRIGIFRESIGDLEAILDSEMKMEDGKRVSIIDALKYMGRDFYSDKLTQEEAEKKRVEIERAIENEKLNLKKIEEGLTNTLTNDSYFKDEINKIVNNNAYVTSYELCQFVRQIIKEHLTSCELKTTENSAIYILQIPKSDSKVMSRFLNQYHPVDADSKKLLNKYLREIDDQLELKITFDQELAFRDKTMSFINIYHPIIRAGVKMFEEKRDRSQCTFFFELDSSHLSKEIQKGLYMLAIYKVTVKRTLFDKPIQTESLYPILFDVHNKCIVEKHELAEHFLGRAQVDGHYAPMEESNRLDNELIADLHYDLNECISNYVREYQHDLQNRIDNNKKLRYQQTIQYYDTRQKSLENVIANYEEQREDAIYWGNDSELRKVEGVLRLQRANLHTLEEKRMIDLDRINRDVHLKVIPEISSLNLVQVV